MLHDSESRCEVTEVVKYKIWTKTEIESSNPSEKNIDRSCPENTLQKYLKKTTKIGSRLLHSAE